MWLMKLETLFILLLFLYCATEFPREVSYVQELCWLAACASSSALPCWDQSEQLKILWDDVPHLLHQHTHTHTASSLVQLKCK